MTRVNPHLADMHDRGVVDPDEFDRWLESRGMAWQPLSRGEYGLTLDEAQLAYVCSDPVLWATAFLDEPDTGAPYGFFEYQTESVRAWRQDAVHQDGAEVGKTREITVLLLWGMCTSFGGEIPRPWCLVAAPQQTHLDEIILAIEEHIGVDEAAAKANKSVLGHFWRKPKKTPHYMMRFASPDVTGHGGSVGRVYFRPAGFDGEAFRGVHVNAMALFDEAAKIKNKVVWSEFHRALKPGCIQRVYSVPDGDNSTEFYRLTQQAVRDLRPGRKGMRLFHWAKTIMPPPFWSAERHAEFVRRYGGEDTPGYQRNVLGLHGQQENPVWPWSTIEPCIRDVPEYRCVRLVVDVALDDLHIIVERVELLRALDGRKSSQTVTLCDRRLSWKGFRADVDAPVRLLREWIEPPGAGVYWGGADLGFSADPSELFLQSEVGAELRLLVRVHLRGVGYDAQAAIIDALDALAGRRPHWGVDFGSAGTAVVQMLQHLPQYADAGFEERMVGFQFAAALDAIDEDGTVLEEDDPRTGGRRVVRLPAKELATHLMSARMQRGGYALPYDSDVIRHLQNHTATQGARHRIFAKTDDHTIDAARVAMLRKVFDETAGGVDVFSGGVYVR